MGTWYCDDCDNPFQAGKVCKCDDPDCECQDGRGRVACCNECHDNLFGKQQSRMDDDWKSISLTSKKLDEAVKAILKEAEFVQVNCCLNCPLADPKHKVEAFLIKKYNGDLIKCTQHQLYAFKDRICKFYPKENTSLKSDAANWTGVRKQIQGGK